MLLLLLIQGAAHLTDIRQHTSGYRMLRKGRNPELRLKGSKVAGCHKKRMMKMTFRMSRQARAGAAKRTRKREEIKESAFVRR